LAGVLVRQELALRSQAVDTLASRAVFSCARSLVGYLAEKGALGIPAPALVPIVANDRDKLFIGKADDLRIGKSERTARDAVVSGTSQRIAVHLPEENRLVLGLGLVARLGQIGKPVDFQPFFLAWMGRDQGV
jgi:hypothetical protein